MKNSCCVVTTVNPPSPAVSEWEKRFGDRLIVIGDKKTPIDWACGRAHYLSLETQNKLPLESLKFTPENHYVRKNIGYLHAMPRGNGSAIFETDDDNTPTEAWSERQETCLPMSAKAAHGRWVNVYRSMGQDDVWPRGIPLSSVRSYAYLSHNESMECPIQQGLANGNPDVDAVWRMTQSRSVAFDLSMRIALKAGSWCPFNSQSTWWFPSAFPLMYLPIHATFRMCDIWRSFVAQRCLWAMGKSVVFHSPAEVVQDRNVHNLLADLKDEIPGYLHNEAIAKALDETGLDSGVDLLVVLKNLRTCYDTMVAGGFLPVDELKAVDAWCADVRMVLARPEWEKI